MLANVAQRGTITSPQEHAGSGWQSVGHDSLWLYNERAKREAASQNRPADIIFSVQPAGLPRKEAGTAAEVCVAQTLSAGHCSNQDRGILHPQEMKRETCSFELESSDVVFGVWHSLATEERLRPLLDTWGAQANIVLLASTIGARDSKLFQPGVAGSWPHLLGEI